MIAAGRELRDVDPVVERADERVVQHHHLIAAPAEAEIEPRAEVAAQEVVEVDAHPEQAEVREVLAPRGRREKRLAAEAGVKLTPAGKKTLAKLRALQRSIDDDFFAPLSAEERAKLHTLLHRLATYHDPRFGNGHA